MIWFGWFNRRGTVFSCTDQLQVRRRTRIDLIDADWVVDCAQSTRLLTSQLRTGYTRDQVTAKDEQHRYADPAVRGTKPEPGAQEAARKPGAALEVAAWGTLAAVLAVLLITVERPGGPFWSALFNVAHVVLSGGVVLVSLRLSRRLFADTRRGILLQYGMALGVVTFLGASLEVVQIFGPGEASFGDLALDVLGALAAVLCAVSFDHRFRQELTRSWSRIWSLRVVAGGLLCFCAIPLAKVTTAIVHRRLDFPVLCSFDSRWDRLFAVTGNGAVLAVGKAPKGFHSARGSAVAKVAFPHGYAFPKFELRGPLGDWSGYQALAFQIFSQEKTPVTLTLRVHDQRHRNSYADRFNREITVQPGDNEISVPLADVRRAPESRAMDMASIRGLMLFAHSPDRSIAIYLDEFRLE